MELPTFFLIISITALLTIGVLFWLSSRMARIKGFLGEWTVKNQLRKLDRKQYVIFHDLYIPKSDGSTAQVDHLVLSPYGIFVIETKNFKGWIFGKEGQKNWTQTIYRKKRPFYNPIWQNSGHTKALQAFLEHERETDWHSLVVFTRRATFKFQEPFQKAAVLYPSQLIGAISQWQTRTIPANVLQSWKRKLDALSKQPKKDIQKKHVQAVQAIQQQAGCPKCGGKLVERTGQYGTFRGCERFPRCRFTKNNEKSSR